MHKQTEVLKVNGCSNKKRTFIKVVFTMAEIKNFVNSILFKEVYCKVLLIASLGNVSTFMANPKSWHDFTIFL